MKDEYSSKKDTDGKTADLRSDVPVLQNLCLRVLATTDIHMQLLGYDYAEDAALPHHGLAGIATLVKHARAEACAHGVASLLLDNGDLLQGSILGETLARQQVSADHPIVRCLAEMGYDAIGLGNHDLDHGLEYLFDIAAHCTTPWISSNLVPDNPAPLRRSVLLDCALRDRETAAPVTLRIGILSALPDDTAIWNNQVIRGQARVHPAKDAVAGCAQRLKNAGADIIILLAHFGVEDTPGTEDARSLAAVPGVDVVIAGHTHLRLPGKDHAGYLNVDTAQGMLTDRPAVMAGFNGSDLGVLDLKLGQHPDGNWRILRHATRLIPNTAAVEPDQKISGICAPAHHLTKSRLALPVGQTDVPIHNFFSLAMPTMTCAIVANAKRHIVQQGLWGSPYDGLPVLAAASAHTAGGRGGPANFLLIPKGPILRRHLAGLNPFVNEICALKLSGREIRNWLEHSAGVYAQLKPDAADQPLIQPQKPAFDFDTIFGLDYVIDPTQPPGERVRNIRFDGQPVQPTQSFVLATNQFRAAGGGGGARFDTSQRIFQTKLPIAKAIEAVIDQPLKNLWPGLYPWRLRSAQPLQAVLTTAPQAQNHLADIAHLRPEPLGTGADGFLKIRLTL